jgi:hypothetical protein
MQSIIILKYLLQPKDKMVTLFGLELEQEDTHKHYKINYLIIMSQDLISKMHDFKNAPLKIIISLIYFTFHEKLYEQKLNI